jgi:phage terminase large subunit-like protein
MIEEDIGYALHGGEGKSFCIYIGTPFNLRDPLMNAIIDGTWTPVVFPICERISPDITEDEWRGSWEDRHSYKAVMTKYKTALHKGTLPAFMQEQMLRVASEEDRLIKDGMINSFSRGDIILNAQNYTWYITTDFTTTGSKSSDYSVIAVWAVSNNEDYMLMDLSIKKLELTEQYDMLFSMVRKYKKLKGYLEVGVEVDGNQRTHIFALEQLMVKHSEFFTIAKQKGKTHKGILRRAIQGNKFDHFMFMVPHFQNGKIWVANEVKETEDFQIGMSQLSYITHMGIGSKHDDFIDAISMLAHMNIIVPSSGSDEVKELTYNIEDGIWEEDDYYEESSGSSVMF